MSVGLDLLGKSFTADQISTGAYALDGKGSVTFSQVHPASEFQVSTLTITGLTTHADGTTSIVASAHVKDGTIREVKGDLLANGSNDFILYDPSSKESSAVYISNDPAKQPGNGKSVTVPAESKNIVYQPVCFVSGTRLRTARGEVAVEDLRVGDLAITRSGRRRRVRWLGHRVIERPAWASAPVRVLAGAFGAELPQRDLYLSPGHPVLVGADEDGEGGHLVPIMLLINGTTIERVAVDAVTY